MQVGDLVKEIVTDEAWRLYSDTVGVVYARWRIG